MSDKLTALPEDTLISDDDLVYKVDDPAWTPLSRKITWANIKAVLKTHFDAIYESLTNKSTTLDADKASDTKYPSVKSVFDWAVWLFVKIWWALWTPASWTATNITWLPEAWLTLVDNTTNDVSTSKHWFAPKGSWLATEFLNGNGGYSVPAGWWAAALDFAFPHAKTNFTPFTKEITNVIWYTPPSWKVAYITSADTLVTTIFMHVNSITVWEFSFVAWQGRVWLIRPLILNDSDVMDLAWATTWSISWFEVDEDVDITPITTSWTYTVPAWKYYIITNMYSNSTVSTQLFTIWSVAYDWIPYHNVTSTDISVNTVNLPILWPGDTVDTANLNHNWYLVPTSFIS